jgi:hypothetical protein
LASPESRDFSDGKKHFTEGRIASVPRQAESGTLVAERMRVLGISEADVLPSEEAVRRARHRRVAADGFFVRVADRTARDATPAFVPAHDATVGEERHRFFVDWLATSRA